VRAVDGTSAVVAQSDFDLYWQFYLDREQERTHTSRYNHQHALAADSRRRSGRAVG